jgi:hypothetical protein
MYFAQALVSLVYPAMVFELLFTGLLGAKVASGFPHGSQYYFTVASLADRLFH